MRVAHVIYRYLPVLGGAEAYVQALREALVGAADGQTVYQADLGTGGEGVVAVPVRRRTGLKLVDFNLALAARRREVLAHDVVIVHNPEHLTRGLAGPRTVLLSHGATWTHEANLLRRWLRCRAMRDAFRRAGAVVANDTFVLRAMGHDVAPGTRLREEVAPGACGPRSARGPRRGPAPPCPATVAADHGPTPAGTPARAHRARFLDTP